MKNLPLEPGPSLGITSAAVLILSIAFGWWMRKRRAKEKAELEYQTALEAADVLGDWGTYLLAVYAGDLQFGNDPNNILRNLILSLCILSSVALVPEVVVCIRHAQARQEEKKKQEAKEDP